MGNKVSETKTETVHLVCNAHIDPVWLWSWEEGLAVTLSTFRVAARFCEKHEGFVFCHNESLLYQWVEIHEPALFRRITRLVKSGRWKIIGGWYLQPDCNLPSGEGFVRQILEGKSYFKKWFGVEPETAVNFDPFGHSQGLVQILSQAGYHSYLFCRPGLPHLDVPNDFRWTGFDGSEVLAHRSLEHYNSEYGKAAEKLSKWIDNHPIGQSGLFLWGIGNHGGGPSEKDLIRIDDLRTTTSNLELRHSWPEAYFEELRANNQLPSVDSDLNPWAVGCYTSMSRVKQMYRELEECLILTEKITTHVTAISGMKPPRRELKEAIEDLLFCQFHDILPGSGIPEVESLALRKMSHALEILSRLQTKAFFKLLDGQPAAKPLEYPILVYNPEPYDIETTLEVELQGLEPNFNPEVYLSPRLLDQQGLEIDVQTEKEASNIANDHRKRLVFNAKLKASTMNRFSCYLDENAITEKPVGPFQRELVFKNEDRELEIDQETGLILRYQVKGHDYLLRDAFKLLVMNDSADPWGMMVNSFSEQIGVFQLGKQSDTAYLAGTSGPIQPLRIIEDGPVRTVVEGLFLFHGSSAVVRYLIPATGTHFDVEIRVFWFEKDRMLKLAIPTTLSQGECRGQVAYGVQRFDRKDEELVAHRWVGLFDEVTDRALTIANKSIYGFDYGDGELRLSLLRSPAYSGHPLDGQNPIVPQDRFTPRIDQGEHLFRFRVDVGSYANRYESIDLESRILNQPPPALCCYPAGRRKKPAPLVQLSNPVIRLAALKMAENSNDFVIRLFNPTDRPRETRLSWKEETNHQRLFFKPFEIMTLKSNPDTGEFNVCNLLESEKMKTNEVPDQVIS